jgi:ATP-dependent Lhr-like helicase
VRCVARDTVGPSPWASGILTAKWYAWLDDAGLEERRTRAVQAARPGELVGTDLTALDAAVVRDVVAEAQATPRDADELHDLLFTNGLAPPRTEWQDWFESLRDEGRATTMRRPGTNDVWVATERVALVRMVFPNAEFHPPPAWASESPPDTDELAARVQLVAAYLATSGPVQADAIAAALGLEVGAVDEALGHIESDGRVLRGSFGWCDRNLLQRIHRKTLQRGRERIRAVDPPELVRFLARWQHAAPGTQLHGTEGLLRVIEQLQGLELSQAAWEKHVLPQRVADYQPAMLDQLCLSGDVAWSQSDSKLALYLRADAAHLLAPRLSPYEPVPPPPTPPWTWSHLSDAARAVSAELDRRGASFTEELQAALGRGTDELEAALTELVRAGVITNDAFIRKRKRPGRWSMLRRPTAPDADTFWLPRLYLKRWGVVTRELFARDASAPRWRDLVPLFRRLEARGEIRGGRFVRGLSGEQYALPEALDALYALPRATDDDLVTVNAVDPLNLVGILGGGARVPAQAHRKVSYRAGMLADVAQSSDASA